jgi:diguanylate cyclase (GGDEF)-like protein/PAS domain S-box-containing protein
MTTSHPDSLANDPELITLKSAIDAASACIFIKNSAGQYTYVNRQFLNLLGRPLAQVLGKPDSAFFKLSNARATHELEQRVLSSGESIDSEQSLTIKTSGEQRIYASTTSPVRDTAGVITGICGIYTDITERKKAEVKLQDRMHLMDTILNNVNAFVYMKDSQRRYHYANRAVMEALELKEEDIVGKRDLDIMTEEEANYVWEQDAKVFATNCAQEREEYFIDPKGRLRYFWTVSVPFKFDHQLSTLIGISTDVTEPHNLRVELQRLASTDTLTGLKNRRHFFELANSEFQRSRRHNSPLSVLVLDIDHFKSINDSYGHPVGDQVLIGVANQCLSSIRAEDSIARIGGEEFAILLPNTPTTDTQSIISAKSLAERIRLAVTELSFSGEWPGQITTSISIGVATLQATDKSFDDLYSRADRALYIAKNNGRNQTHSE